MSLIFAIMVTSIYTLLLLAIRRLSVPSWALSSLVTLGRNSDHLVNIQSCARKKRKGFF